MTATAFLSLQILNFYGSQPIGVTVASDYLISVSSYLITILQYCDSVSSYLTVVFDYFNAVSNHFTSVFYYLTMVSRY